MKKNKQSELVIAGLIIPWVIVAILALVLFLSGGSGKEKDKEIQELSKRQQELIESNNQNSINLRKSKDEIVKLKKILKKLPSLSIYQKSWKGKHGNIFIKHSLKRSGGITKLERVFSDGSSGLITVEVEKKGSSTYLRPKPSLATGDYYVIRDTRLMCMDKLGSVYMANEE